MTVLAIVLSLVGCTIDPKPDYQQARDRISRATGQPVPYEPDDEGVIEGRVGALLQDGLTVEKAVQVCLLNNPDIQAGWLSIGMARADLVQSGLLSNPTFDLSLRFPSAGGLPDISADLAQNIADLWQIPVRKRVSQHALDQAILALASTAASVAADAKTAYCGVGGTQQALDIAQENLAIAQKSLDLALVRQQVGAGAEIDVNLARGPVLDAELAIRAARLALGEARRTLAKLLGVTSDTQKLILLDPLPAPPVGGFDAETLLAVARTERLDLQAAAQAVAVAEAQVEQQRLAVLPSLSLGVATEKSQTKAEPGRKILADTARTSIASGTLTAPGIEPRSARRAAKRANDNAVITGPTFNLPLPIFDQNQAQIAKAIFAYRQAAKAYESLDRALTQDVRGAVDRAATAWDVARFYRTEVIPLAQRNLDLGRESYKAGKASLLEILDLQKFLVDARSRYVQSAADAAMKIADLERTTGLPLRELGAPTMTAPADSTLEPTSMSATRPRSDDPAPTSNRNETRGQSGIRSSSSE